MPQNIVQFNGSGSNGNTRICALALFPQALQPASVVVMSAPILLTCSIKVVNSLVLGSEAVRGLGS